MVAVSEPDDADRNALRETLVHELRTVAADVIYFVA